VLKLSQLVRDAVATEAARLRSNLRDAVMGVLLLMVGGLIGLIGLAFLIVGAYGSLVQSLPAWQAGGIVACGVLVLAGVILLLGYRFLGGRRPPPRGRRLEDSAVAAEIRRATEEGIGAGESRSRERRRGQGD
jgi:membrane protein implicated in regulation of membrane protease activity